MIVALMVAITVLLGCSAESAAPPPAAMDTQTTPASQQAPAAAEPAAAEPTATEVDDSEFDCARCGTTTKSALAEGTIDGGQPICLACADEIAEAKERVRCDRCDTSIARSEVADTRNGGKPLCASCVAYLARPTASPSTGSGSGGGSGAYIGNSNTGKFHHAYCGSVSQMNPENKVPMSSRSEAVSAGYIPCKNCNP